MKLRFLTLITALTTILLGFACSDTGSNTANNSRANMNVNRNTAVVVNATPASSNTNRWNSNISKEEYEKDKAGYEREKSTSEVIGDGINDSWLWFKTRSALA